MAKTKARKTAQKTTKPAARKAAPRKTARRKPAVPKPRALTPYLGVNDGAAAIAWYKDVFGAKPLGDVQPGPGGKVMHAALMIGDSQLFLSDIFPGADLVDPTRAGPSVNLHYTRPNADDVWKRAVAKGAKVTMPFEDMFWGDKYGRMVDPFGHSWAIARKSKLSKAQLADLREKAMREFQG